MCHDRFERLALEFAMRPVLFVDRVQADQAIPDGAAGQRGQARCLLKELGWKRKGVHPKDTDPREQLREFAIRTVIRTIVAISGIVYVNFFLSDGLPRVTTRYALIIASWSERQQYLAAVTTILSQILMLHIFIVIARLLLLRKKAFDS